MAISIGAFGFSSGAIRFIAVTHQELFGMINIASMAFLLVVTVILFAVWRTRAFRLDLVTVFRAMFPVAGTCPGDPFPLRARDSPTSDSPSRTRAFALTCILMMMHCAQISRDSGISPVFHLRVLRRRGVFHADVRLRGGLRVGKRCVARSEQLSLVAVVSLYVMLLVALLGRRVSKLHTSRLEFLMMSPRRVEDAGVRAPPRRRTMPRERRRRRRDGARWGCAGAVRVLPFRTGAGVNLDSSAASGAGSTRLDRSHRRFQLGAELAAREDLTAIRCARVRAVRPVEPRGRGDGAHRSRQHRPRHRRDAFHIREHHAHA